MNCITRISNAAGSCCGTLAAVITAIVMTALASSCASNGCTDNRSSLPLAGFYAADTGSTIALDSLDIGGIGAPADSLLLAAGESATQVYLPLRAQQSSTVFFIAYRYKDLDFEAINDTLTFEYDATPYFASEECGAMMQYRIRRLLYTRHILDSIAIIPDDSVINNADIENLRLYFKTTSADNQ